ncbi:MAG: cytochrome c oxidase subunit II [Bacteroidia bacterium]|nr:cytochrome c oxidase subunit II [Bacteroidia bacterium]MCZ2248172.1 cytochrome c oxidase subunit II [Bacteroidia bacterium]
MISFLTIVTLVLGVVAFANLIKVYELSSTLKGSSPDEDPIPDSENRFNSNMMMVFIISFLIFCAWVTNHYWDHILPEAASEHGQEVDKLNAFNYYIITFVFVVVNFLLFFFAYKYYAKKGRTAFYFPHNAKLELLWTIIPAAFLTVVSVYGLSLWNKITTPADHKDAIVMEVFGEQFKWTARYAGRDNTLGKFDYRLTGDMNPLALDTTDKAAWDDKLVNGELHIPVGKTVIMYFRSKDVIHSAYMPHFRAQMNVVPGMVTQFHFKPTITTAEMREKTKNPEFDYLLLCNKICGATHWNMQMNIIVDSEKDYKEWLREQDTFKKKYMSAQNNNQNEEIKLASN